VKASELAALVGGELVGLDRSFSGVAPLDQPRADAVCYAEDAKGVVGEPGVLLANMPVDGVSTVVVADPKRAFVRLLEQCFVVPETPGIHPGASVDPTATLGERVVVYPGVVVGARCVIGDDTVLFPNVVLYPGTILGSNVRIHAGAMLGADGFSYDPTPDGPRKVPQLGCVRVEDGVEIGANTCIDRAFLGETVIGTQSKIDNLVQVGHNDQLGAGVILAAQVGLSGSVTVGDGVMMGGQVGVVDHVNIRSGVRLGGQAGVPFDMTEPGDFFGSPAMPLGLWKRAMLLLRRLPEMWLQIGRLERRIAELEENRSSHQFHDE